MAYGMISMVVFLLSMLIRAASALGILLPLLYALIVPTVFQGWYHSHLMLAEGIGWAILALSVLSAGFRLIQKFRG